jgi:hypothetical protein
MATADTKLMKLDDVGTRFDHFGELLDLWKEGSEHYRRSHGLSAAMKKEDLEVAVRLLMNTMAVMGGEYDENYYRKEVNIIARNQAKEEPTAEV